MVVGVAVSAVRTGIDLRGLAARASTLQERLDGAVVPDPAAVLPDRPVGPEQPEARLAAWRLTLGNGDEERLRRRLTWDGLDLGRVRPLLGPVRLREGEGLPAWVWLTEEVLGRPIARRDPDGSWPSELGFLDPARPVPFEEVLAAYVVLALERLDDGSGDVQALGPKAWAALGRSLLTSLSWSSDQVLLSRFEADRSAVQTSWDRLLATTLDPDSREVYLSFAEGLGSGGLAELYEEFPVLARVLATTTLLWVDAQAELLARLAADRADLESLFGEGRALGTVTGVEAGLSDPHRGGRSVLALTFAAGCRVVYKPKDLGTEAAYQRLLGWLNDHGAPADLRLTTVLDRGTHGWVELVENTACATPEAGARYYRRAGVLLCLFYALEVTDCHYENLIACGEHPVLIDAETLLHHRASPVIPADGSARAEALDQIDRSVLRIGFLPRWELTPDRTRAFHMSALGEADEEELPVRRPRWVRTNTDRMTLEPGPGAHRSRTNIPRLGEVPLRLQDHGPELVAGFRAMYAYLLEHRDELLASEPMQDLARQQVRFVFRPTGIYDRILYRLRLPRLLRDGADRSIELEQLGRMLVPPRALLAEPDRRPVLWPVLAAELAAMQLGDIPFFTAGAASTSIHLPEGEVTGAFELSSHDAVVERLSSMGAEDLERQVAFVEGSMYAHLARDVAPGPFHEVEATVADRSAIGSDDVLVQQALDLAESIRSRAIRAPDGSASWIAPQLLTRVGRYQLQPMNFDLYSGSAGVAVFLAAADRFAPGSGFGDLARSALQPVHRELGLGADRLAATMGIGAAAGLGSLTYALRTVGVLLGDAFLLDQARTAAGSITPARIDTDVHHDVVGGAAGAVLGLLALHETAPEEWLLRRAVHAGEHLLGRRTPGTSGLRSWASPDGIRGSGFAHGTAGVAYALLRLYRTTGDARFREAAVEAIAEEDTRWSEPHGTWTDHAEPGQPIHASQWCRGAGGIGLARTAGLTDLDTPEVRLDVDRAVAAVLEFGPQGLDHPCCGTTGRAEVLLVAGQRLARADLVAASRTFVATAVSRAERDGGFVLHPRLPPQVDAPAFFQGKAGVGYQLLRQVDPAGLPVVLLWE